MNVVSATNLKLIYPRSEVHERHKWQQVNDEFGLNVEDVSSVIKTVDQRAYHVLEQKYCVTIVRSLYLNRRHAHEFC